MTNASAQFNINVGYSAQYSPLKSTNSLFDTYNASKPNITKPYSNINYIHGLELGIRYMFGLKFGIEAGFNNLLTKDNKTSSLENNVIINDEWRVSNRQINFGIENYFGTFGYGLSLVHSTWKYSKDEIGNDKKLEILKSSDLAAKISLIIQAKSYKNAFALRPYYLYPFKRDTDITALKNVLNGSSSVSVTENFESFGISLIFYNGPQTN
jgi:hypothetical protein